MGSHAYNPYFCIYDVVANLFYVKIYSHVTECLDSQFKFSTK